MNAGNVLIQGAPVRLEGGKGPVDGVIVSLDDGVLRVKIKGRIFPFGYSEAEEFHQKGILWQRVFPDPFTRRQCVSHNEPLYRLTFIH